jgi:hypothetical protein
VNAVDFVSNALFLLIGGSYVSGVHSSSNGLGVFDYLTSMDFGSFTLLTEFVDTDFLRL